MYEQNKYVYIHHSCFCVVGFERSAVDDLSSVVLFVSYLDSTVNLHLTLNLNNSFQTIKDLLNLATIKLSVLAIGSGKIETSNPIHMKVNVVVCVCKSPCAQYKQSGTA